MSRVISSGPELGVARLDLELLDVDRRVVVVLHHPLGHEDRVLEVVAAPRHERDEHVPAERQLAELRARPVAQHLPLVHLLADPDDRLLGDAGVLVRPLELRHRVDVGAHLLADRPRSRSRRGRRCAGCRRSRWCRTARATMTAPESRAVMYSMPVPTNGARARSSGTAWRCMFDPISARFASSFSRNGMSDAATETSCFGETSMNCTLSRGARMKLPACRALTRSCVSLPSSSTGGVRLRDDVLVLFPRRQVEGVGLELDAFLLRPAVLRHQLVGLDDVAGLVLRPGGVGDEHVVGDAAVLDLPVRRLDEAELVDARVARQRRDEADVRTFRRLNRADAPVVRRVDVAHLEPGALARQTARPERRETPLVRDLRERVGLVHELRRAATTRRTRESRP